MIKKILFSSLLLSSIHLNAQTEKANEQVNFELGNGLSFNFNDGAYQFKLGGMIQPSIAFEKLEKEDADLFLNSKRTYFNFSGKAVEEKVSFFLQTDYSLNEPLLDAWIGFHPTENLNIYFGQKQSLAKNRELQIMETNLQFPNRSLLSTELSQSGREFGLFMDYRLGNSEFSLIPQIAVSSGDGRNSFGSDSRDVDLGGLKYAARLDVLPLGDFSTGNEDLVADLAGEKSPKILIGAAASFNDGASGREGAGHGDFLLYNKKGNNQLPDYRQVYADLLFKYQGFSLLGEYAIATATNLKGTYTDEAGLNELQKTSISEYLALGTAMNIQLGYVYKQAVGLDLRWSNTSPEFDKNKASQLREQEAMTLGLTRYLKNNELKLQAAVSSITDKTEIEEKQTLRGELIFQLIF